jgi:enolase
MFFRKKITIKKVKAREILDSRSEPTVEVLLETDLGVFKAAAPSGASKGKYEAHFLRDGNERFQGKGVLKAVQNVNEVIGKSLIGEKIDNQKRIDELLIEIDGTPNKSLLGVNAILPLSMAVCRAGAAFWGLPLFEYLREINNNFFDIKKNEYRLPLPCFNVIEGGVHGGGNLDIQEFLVVPTASATFSEALRFGSEIYQLLKKSLNQKYGKVFTNLADEGGFSVPFKKTFEVLDFLFSVIYQRSEEMGFHFALDCAASQFYKDGFYNFEGSRLTFEDLFNFYAFLVKKYPVIFLEDPFFEDDFEGFRKIRKELGSQIVVVGDDLLATNLKRIELAQQQNLCNGAIIKMDQVGTIWETLKAVKLCRDFNWKVIISHRSGETNDDFIADLAVGVGADFIKAGAPARGERVAKYNRLLEIENFIKTA